MAKKNKKKKSGSSRKSGLSMAQKAARQGMGSDPYQTKKGPFGNGNMSGMIVGFVIVVITILIVSFQ